MQVVKYKRHKSVILMINVEEIGNVFKKNLKIVVKEDVSLIKLVSVMVYHIAVILKENYPFVLMMSFAVR